MDEIFFKPGWKYIYTRRMTYQKVRLYHPGYIKLLGDKEDGVEYTIYRFSSCDCRVYQLVSELDKMQNFFGSLLTEKKSAQTLKRIYKIEKDFKNYIRKLNKLPKKFRGLDNKKLVEILNDYFQVDNKISVDFWIIFNEFEFMICKMLEESLKLKGYGKDNREKLMEELAEPLKIIPVEELRLSILKAAVSYKSINASKRLEKRYGHMPMYDINYVPHGFDFYMNEINEVQRLLSKKEILEEIKNIENKYRKRLKHFNKLIKPLDRYSKRLARIFNKFGYLKERKPFVRDYASVCVQPLFREIAKRSGLTLEQVLFLHIKEIEQALSGKKINLNEVNARLKNSAYLCSAEDIQIITDENLLKKLDTILEKKSDDTFVKGLGVTKGKAVGAVGMVLSNEDFGKFEDGDILVASATRPDYVALMKKASAIVTDEGGMLSHAAIVSRELGIPCVVGTKYATKLLKDGDLVEVDADKGVVRILERSGNE